MRKLLNISDLKKEDFFNILSYAEKLENTQDMVLNNKNIGLIFEKNSTRTRLSFQVGINQLNGNCININLNELNLERIESFEDTFQIMSCYLDCIIYRTTDHEKLKLAYKYFKKPLINALSDISHPCQAISDVYTLRKYFKRNDNFKIVWLGDLNNVLFSLIEVVEMLENSTIDIFTNKSIYNQKKNIFNFSNKVTFNFELNLDILSSADCIMTDVYNSMNDTENKETKLKKFQVNKFLMDKTSENAVFMHCLPANIDSEVTSDVLNGSKSIVIKQAENRLHAQKGILKWLSI